MKKNQTEILDMQYIIDQIKKSVESLFKRVDQVEDRILELEDRLPSFEYSDII